MSPPSSPTAAVPSLASIPSPTSSHSVASTSSLSILSDQPAPGTLELCILQARNLHRTQTNQYSTSHSGQQNAFSIQVHLAPLHSAAAASVAASSTECEATPAPTPSFTLHVGPSGEATWSEEEGRHVLEFNNADAWLFLRAQPAAHISTATSPPGGALPPLEETDTSPSPSSSSSSSSSSPSSPPLLTPPRSPLALQLFHRALLTTRPPIHPGLIRVPIKEYTAGIEHELWLPLQRAEGEGEGGQGKGATGGAFVSGEIRLRFRYALQSDASLEKSCLSSLGPPHGSLATQLLANNGFWAQVLLAHLDNLLLKQNSGGGGGGGADRSSSRLASSSSSSTFQSKHREWTSLLHSLLVLLLHGRMGLFLHVVRSLVRRELEELKEQHGGSISTSWAAALFRRNSLTPKLISMFALQTVEGGGMTPSASANNAAFTNHKETLEVVSELHLQREGVGKQYLLQLLTPFIQKIIQDCTQATHTPASSTTSSSSFTSLRVPLSPSLSSSAPGSHFVPQSRDRGSSSDIGHGSSSTSSLNPYEVDPSRLGVHHAPLLTRNQMNLIQACQALLDLIVQSVNKDKEQDDKANGTTSKVGSVKEEEEMEEEEEEEAMIRNHAAASFWAGVTPPVVPSLPPSLKFVARCLRRTVEEYVEEACHSVEGRSEGNSEMSSPCKDDADADDASYRSPTAATTAAALAAAAPPSPAMPRSMASPVAPTTPSTPILIPGSPSSPCVDSSPSARVRIMRESLHNSLSSFFFLRFLCPALVSPVHYGLLTTPPPAAATRALILIAKVLQSLVNAAGNHVVVQEVDTARGRARTTFGQTQPVSPLPRASSLMFESPIAAMEMPSFPATPMGIGSSSLYGGGGLSAFSSPMIGLSTSTPVRFGSMSMAMAMGGAGGGMSGSLSTHPHGSSTNGNGSGARLFKESFMECCVPFIHSNAGRVTHFLEALCEVQDAAGHLLPGIEEPLCSHELHHALYTLLPFLHTHLDGLEDTCIRLHDAGVLSLPLKQHVSTQQETGLAALMDLTRLKPAPSSPAACDPRFMSPSAAMDAHARLKAIRAHFRSVVESVPVGGQANTNNNMRSTPGSRSSSRRGSHSSLAPPNEPPPSHALDRAASTPTGAGGATSSTLHSAASHSFRFLAKLLPGGGNKWSSHSEQQRPPASAGPAPSSSSGWGRFRRSSDACMDTSSSSSVPASSSWLFPPQPRSASASIEDEDTPAQLHSPSRDKSKGGSKGKHKSKDKVHIRSPPADLLEELDPLDQVAMSAEDLHIIKQSSLEIQLDLSRQLEDALARCRAMQSQYKELEEKMEQKDEQIRSLQEELKASQELNEQLMAAAARRAEADAAADASEDEIQLDKLPAIAPPIAAQSPPAPVVPHSI